MIYDRHVKTYYRYLLKDKKESKYIQQMFTMEDAIDV